MAKRDGLQPWVVIPKVQSAKSYSLGWMSLAGTPLKVRGGRGGVFCLLRAWSVDSQVLRDDVCSGVITGGVTSKDGNGMKNGLRPPMVKVNASRRCPVCDHADWCLVSHDEPPSRAICQRVESKKRAGDAGWLHILRDGVELPPMPVRTEREPTTKIEFDRLAAKCVNNAKPERLVVLADGLGLSVKSLQCLNVGWYRNAWSFPMMDAGLNVLGIRLRLADGKKISVKGGHEGLFIPAGDRPKRLLVCEGPTDTAALLDLGFYAVGRPNCSGGTRHLVALVREWGVEQVTILADRDGPGFKGASVLARCLASFKVRCSIVTPPAKDPRAWKNAGATTKDVLKLLRWRE